MFRTAHIGHKAVGAQPPFLQRCRLSSRQSLCNRQHRLCVTASGSSGGNSRVIRGKCYVTRDVRGSCICLAYFIHDYIKAKRVRNVHADCKTAQHSLTTGGGRRT